MPSTINRFIKLFVDAFERLGVELSMPAIEQLAMDVHHGMEYGLRVYHTSPHALEMCRDMNPHQVLAGLYHDLVYYQLDGGFPRQFDAYLREVVDVQPDGLRVRKIDRSVPGMVMCSTLFDFKIGDLLPLYGGLNEFLSAIVAVRCLSGHLSNADLLRTLAIVSATVPYWGRDQNSRKATDTLALRLVQLNNEFKIGLTQQEIDATVHDSVVVSNRDVGGFAVEDPGVFLYVTWMLIEESNAPLAAIGVYSIQDYRRALQRMESFLATLSPNNIFHSYKDVPNEQEMRRLAIRAKVNLAFSVKYLDAKLASISVLEAFALESGGDAPVSMFLGDLKPSPGSTERIENYLPAAEDNPDLDTLLLDVLEHGRRMDVGSDLSASPVTVYLYRTLGMSGIIDAVSHAKQMFAGELSPREFLARLPQEPVKAVLDACRQIAISRTTRLDALRASL